MNNMLSPSDWLTREERKALLEKSDWKGAYEVLFDWLVIAASFALVIYFPNPLSYLVAWLVIGGRQLACSVVMHDTGHIALFKTRWLNDFAGKWLGAYPVLSDMTAYRPYHNVHHVHNGTEDDPDLLLTANYPAQAISMARKFFRDISGQTGVKTQFAFVLMQVGILKYNLGKKVERITEPKPTTKSIFINGVKNLSGPIGANIIIFGILWMIGHPWLYMLWFICLFTTFQLFIRIRSMAEHSMVESTLDPYANTRTTYANVIERLLVAPHFVNYHAEHHMMMTVPPYNLPRMHDILLRKGFFEKGPLEKGYLSLIKKAIV